MMDRFDNNNLSDKTVYCRLCNERPKAYTCPRCGIGYCNLDCYKSQAHLECSESFYKEHVEEELKSSESDPDSRKKMIDILKRVHDQSLEDYIVMDEENEDDSQLDSDDEEDLPDLDERLKDINLDNANQVWAVLSDAEKQEFETLIKSGEAEKLLPKWTPWWTTTKKPLVQVLNSAEKSVETRAQYPELIEVQPFNEQLKVSPNLRFNIMNVVYAYAYIALYYNGDYYSCAAEAASVFLRICDNIKNNKNFNDEQEVIASIIRHTTSSEHLPKDTETISAFKQAGNLIIRNPEKMRSPFYICIALSEIWRLFAKAQQEIYMSKREKDNQEFLKKFTSIGETYDMSLSKKNVFIYQKKLEFYISWVKSHGKNMCT